MCAETQGSLADKGDVSQAKESQLENQFQGAWGPEAESEVKQTPSPRPLFKARVGPKEGVSMAQQLAGPIGASRYMGSGSHGSGIKAKERDLDSSRQANADDPALGPIIGLRGSGLSVPEGSEVPQASLSLGQQGNKPNPFLGQQNLDEPNPSHEDQAGQSKPAEGMTSQASKDVHLAKAREQLPNLNVTVGNASEGEESRQSAATAKSLPPTPKSAPGIQPTSVESPSNNHPDSAI